LDIWEVAAWEKAFGKEPNISFLTVEISVLRAKRCFNYLYPGSGSMDRHIFADPDPRNQNDVDSTDPDPMH